MNKKTRSNKKQVSVRGGSRNRLMIPAGMLRSAGMTKGDIVSVSINPKDNKSLQIRKSTPRGSKRLASYTVDCYNNIRLNKSITSKISRNSSRKRFNVSSNKRNCVTVQ